MLKAAGMSKALAQLLKLSRKGVGLTEYPLMRERAKLFSQIAEIPEKEWRNIKDFDVSKRLASDSPWTKRLGEHHAEEKLIKINPYDAPTFPDKHVPRHEFTHARQAEKDPGTFRASSIAMARGAGYQEWPHEIQARAVEQSKKPFDEAYTKSRIYIFGRLNHLQDYLSRMVEEGKLPVERFNAYFVEGLKDLNYDVSDLVKKGYLGFGAAGLLYATQQPKEAEAAPPGIFEKAIIRGGEEVSSAASKLIGKQVQGKTITNVLKGKGALRRILFEDETQMIVDKRYINDLTRSTTTQDYLSRFREATQEDKTIQALKSLKMHEERNAAHPAYSNVGRRELTRQHLGRTAELGADVIPDKAFVQRGGKQFAMPREYAEHLEDIGVLKIIRSGEAQKIIERFGGKVKNGPKE